MEYFLVTVTVAKLGDPLVRVNLRVKAQNIVSAAAKIKLFTDNYDYWSLFCFRSVCRREFTKLSAIPSL